MFVLMKTKQKLKGHWQKEKKYHPFCLNVLSVGIYKVFCVNIRSFVK